ncbi:hypothetical protein N7474_002808 [Penicillium riverlandense]|uniref:uncharacterized protein n=1 Tax=Penicillium riverlandense TaxID=1903569 RepID=UPI002547DB5A|nr:uncharacterized protein N7474_002808 [Penicillium riverlandense]KAJ5825670.1 hypothetical protein N7474_002808 [Penicillium riverlandense]
MTELSPTKDMPPTREREPRNWSVDKQLQVPGLESDTTQVGMALCSSQFSVPQSPALLQPAEVVVPIAIVGIVVLVELLEAEESSELDDVESAVVKGDVAFVDVDMIVTISDGPVLVVSVGKEGSVIRVLEHTEDGDGLDLLDAEGVYVDDLVDVDVVEVDSVDVVSNEESSEVGFLVHAEDRGVLDGVDVRDGVDVDLVDVGVVDVDSVDVVSNEESSVVGFLVHAEDRGVLDGVDVDVVDVDVVDVDVVDVDVVDVDVVDVDVVDVDVVDVDVVDVDVVDVDVVDVDVVDVDVVDVDVVDVDVVDVDVVDVDVVDVDVVDVVSVDVVPDEVSLSDVVDSVSDFLDGSSSGSFPGSLKTLHIADNTSRINLINPSLNTISKILDLACDAFHCVENAAEETPLQSAAATTATTAFRGSTTAQLLFVTPAEFVTVSWLGDTITPGGKAASVTVTMPVVNVLVLDDSVTTTTPGVTITPSWLDESARMV